MVETTNEDDPFGFEPQSNTNENDNINTIGSSASTALALLLREDPLLLQHNMVHGGNYNSNDIDHQGSTTNKNTNTNTNTNSSVHKINEEASFAYAASLIHEAHELNDMFGASESAEDISEKPSIHVQQRATDALFDVERKLGLIQSLYLRVARDHPEHVAGTLLTLHGHADFHLPDFENVNVNAKVDENEYKGDATTNITSNQSNTNIPTTTLLATRERCERLSRQGTVLEGVATRVEHSLQRGLVKMERTTHRLQRILQLSATLKMAMRLRFEAKKALGSGIMESLQNASSGEKNNPYAATGTQLDLRDLTRAAASVAAMEELLSHPDLVLSDDNVDANNNKTLSSPIQIVEQMRPEATKVALAVRKAAAGLLAEQQNANHVSKLGATLQVYYHLGELPQAVWGAVVSALAAAEKAASQFFNPAALQRLQEGAKATTKKEEEKEKDTTETSSASNKSKNSDRSTKLKLKEKRAEAAAKWAMAVGDASLKVWNLHGVLARKADPVTRQNFLQVVAEASVPEKFRDSEAHLRQNDDDRNGNGGGGMIPNHLFAIYWNQVCIALGARIQRLLKYDKGSIAREVAALYPAVRAAALDMLVKLNDQMQAGTGASSNANQIHIMAEDGTTSSTTLGILGGSSGLEDSFLLAGNNIDGVENMNYNQNYNINGDTHADSWTHDPLLMDSYDGSNDSIEINGAGTVGRVLSGAAPSTSSSVISGAEWNAMEGYGNMGLSPLRLAFLEASSERLFAPLQYLFPGGVDISVDVSVDEHGNSSTAGTLPTLPTRYDISKIDACIREELSYADPREGGGDLGMTSMMSDNIVNMVARFAISARDATSGAGELGYLHPDGSRTDALMHDQKLMSSLNSLSGYLKNAPDKTFVAPYRPAVSPQHEEASRLCLLALQPALQEIDNVVKKMILVPLCRALNHRISSAIAKIHKGIYLENNTDIDTDNMGGSSFVQTQLNPLYEQIATQHLSKLPTEYAGIVSRIVASYSIYTFVSNVSLVRPLGEMGRLRITQDLADFELALEQLVFKGGSTMALAQIDRGRAYAELRAIRQMLFWTGLDDKHASPGFICKGLLRENWIKDVRPSTIFHFLFSFAPFLLSSPHHSKRMSAEEYVKTLVNYNGSFDDCEHSAWMTTMACCDAYQQRESVDSGRLDGGDKRVAGVLMLLGPELLRRRRQ